MRRASSPTDADTVWTALRFSTVAVYGAYVFVSKMVRPCSLTGAETRRLRPIGQAAVAGTKLSGGPSRYLEI
jgi:hypothetical protein